MTQPRPRTSLPFTALLVAGGAIVFAGAFGVLRGLESAALRAARAQLNDQGQARPIAQVARALAALKLITVEVDTRAARTATDDNWRGLVTARVEAPVRLHFGVDLANMDASRLALSPASGEWIVRVPPPTRLATEIDTTAEQADTTLGWARFQRLDGELLLNRARQGLHQRAHELILDPHTARHVEDLTREQIATLIRKIVGPDARVTVAFDPTLARGGS